MFSDKTTRDLPLDNCIPVTEIEFALSGVTEPSQLVLTVKVPEANAANRWNFWVYPAIIKETKSKPYFTNNYNEAVTRAKTGGNVRHGFYKTYKTGY